MSFKLERRVGHSLHLSCFCCTTGQNRKARPGEYREEPLDQQLVEQAHKDAEVLSQGISVAA